MRAKLAGRVRPGVRLFVPVTVLVSITMLAAACSGGTRRRPARHSPARRRRPGRGRTRMATSPTPGTCRARRSRRRTCPACGKLGVQAGGHGRGRRLGDRLADRAAGRAGRRRVPAGRGRQRVRTGARHGQAEVGVPGQHPGEERARAGRGGGRGRHRVRGLVDLGVRAQRGDRQDDLGGRQPAQQQPGGVRDPAAGGGRAGLPGQRLRLGTGRRGAHGAERVNRPSALEVQHGASGGGRACGRSVSVRAGPGRRRWSGATAR